MTAFYIVKRDETHWRTATRPSVMLCTRRDVARWIAGATDEKSWIWESGGDDHAGLLLVRWQGLDIDYGHVVRLMELPDGDQRAFDHEAKRPETWALFQQATWWSPRRMPAWVEKRGAKYPTEQKQFRAILLDYETDWTKGGMTQRDVVFRWPNAPTEAQIYGLELV